MRRVLIPILMLGLCALIVASYGRLAPTGLGIIDTPTPAFTPTPQPLANPSPTILHPPSPATDSTIPSIGGRAPDFTLPSVWGDMVTLSSYHGQKNVVLLFYRTGG